MGKQKLKAGSFSVYLTLSNKEKITTAKRKIPKLNLQEIINESLEKALNELLLKHIMAGGEEKLETKRGN